MNKPSISDNLTPFIPYLAVLGGIYLLHSVWIAMIVYHLGMAATIWCCRNRGTGVSCQAGARTPLIVMNVLIGLCTGVFLYALWPILGTPQDIGLRLNRLGLTSWLVFGIYYCSVNPILEELFWRKSLATPSSLPARSDLLFAGYHMLVLALFMRWEWCAAAFVLLVLASWIWGITAKARGGIPMTAGSHFLADLGIVLAAYLRLLHG